jgi:hypothetical protein
MILFNILLIYICIYQENIKITLIINDQSQYVPFIILTEEKCATVPINLH